MGKTLVVVESPTKARTITKFLGKDFEVLASYGHVRDLPNSATQIPASIKKEKWTRIGVNVDSNFEALYVVPDDKKDRVKALKDALKNADLLLLATDEDREGESISWHLVEVLQPRIPTKRLVFHEITKQAIAEAVANPREVDVSLVKAQETRRIVDRLYGYMLSPLLWKKMAPGLSAGRVQSVAMRLLVERERERIRFKMAAYWDLKIRASKNSESFEAELSHVNSKRVAGGKDFEPETGKLNEKADVILLDGMAAQALKAEVERSPLIVDSVEEKPYTSKPYAPFTTSTLQQEAANKLRYTVKRTMQIAQSLYENGFITYMRTDSTNLSEEGLTGARSAIIAGFGKEYLSPETRIYKTKVRNAQEAHEAIRPAGSDFAVLADVQAKLGDDAGRLYDLIWKRTVASQMHDARGTRVTALISAGSAVFRATGRTVLFPGYLRAYTASLGDEEKDDERTLPKLVEGEKLSLENCDAIEHQTQPPARYTEASLVKELERRGIGRPSTWASIVDVILSRAYAFKRGTALVPSFRAVAVTGVLEEFFSDLMDYEFTARLEDDLDAISRGEADDRQYLHKFYFGNGHPGLKALLVSGEERIDPRIACGVAVGTDEQGRKIEVRLGRFGPFITNGTDRASLPDMLAPEELTAEKAAGILREAAKGPTVLGQDPATALPVYQKNGRFGPYVQLGDMKEDVKPKMASLLPGMKPEDVTLEIALQLLSLPRLLGPDPQNGEQIFAASGKYGPYIKRGEDTRSISIEDGFSPITITLPQALEIFSQPKQRGRGRKPAMLRVVGVHPVSKAEITLRSGRFGPYVTDGKINASLSRGMDGNNLTVDDAVNLLEARAARIASEDGAPKRSKRGAKKAAANTAEKKAGKKASSKKSSAKSKKKKTEVAEAAGET